MSTGEHAPMSLTMYRVLISLGGLGVLGFASMIGLEGPGTERPVLTYALVWGLYVLVMGLLIHKRRQLVRFDDPKPWPWWGAAAFTLLSGVALSVALILLFR